MKRRDFIAILGAAGWPLAVVGQAPRPARLGVLVVDSPEPFLGGLRHALRERGYVEGRNLHLELRSGQGKPDRLPALATELTTLKVDVLVGWLTPAVHALKGATGSIPIVMLAGDPLATGVVTNLARPGGNVTGVSATAATMGGKTLELIRELLPSAKRVAVLGNATDPFTKPFVEQLENAGQHLGMAVRRWIVREAREFDAAFADMANWRADALIVQPSLPRDAAIALALKHRLPAVSPTPSFPQAGGLMSYAASITPLFGEVAAYIDRILKGAKPGELPVQQPAVYELVFNTKTAKALGISIPRTLLLRADKLIE